MLVSLGLLISGCKSQPINVGKKNGDGAFAAERGPIVNGGPGKIIAPHPKIASAATALASLFCPLDPPLLSMPYRKMKP